MSTACTANPYVIGTYFTGGDAGAGGTDASDGDSGTTSTTFRAPLDSSGASNLASALSLGSVADASVLTTFRLRGELATATAWAADDGTPLTAVAVPAGSLDQAAPFTDATRAVALAAIGATYTTASGDTSTGDLGDGDAAFELVFRAEPAVTIADKNNGGPGWSLTTSAGGALVLGLADGMTVVQASSEPLAADAWYHCMAWIGRSAGARVDCDGHVGALADLSKLGSLASTSALVIGAGSGKGSPLLLADFTLFRGAAGSLGTPSGWVESRRRFAALTGALPTIARGTALPEPNLRSTPAYVDIDRNDGAGRRLFLVGPDWPRIACRNGPSGSFCGYLGEPSRARLVPADPGAWAASEAAVSADRTLFADGELHMSGAIASTAPTVHVLSASAAFAVTEQAFSFFARAETSHSVGLSVSGQGEAVFDLTAKTATSPAGVHAAVEDWGQGVARCSYVFTNAQMAALTWQVHLLDAAGNETFAGDGQSVSVDLAGLQVEIAAPYAGSLLGADSQASDQLVFAANDGNLPSSAPVALKVQVLLPAGARLVDQAIVDLNFEEQYDNQLDLYLTGAQSTLEFLGLQGGTTLWAFNDSSSLVDGNRHSIAARWSPASASVWVDQMPAPAAETSLAPGHGLPVVDRLDVGFSVNSSGYLQGLLSNVELAAP